MPAARRTSSGALTDVVGALAMAVGVVWYGLLMRPVWAASALGPLCGHAQALGPHCPACYAALALTGAGASLAAMRALRLKPALRRSRS